MDIKQLIEEKQKRTAMKLAIQSCMNQVDFSQSVRRAVIHKMVAELLNERVHNGLISLIRAELIRNKIVPTTTGNKRYYRHIDYCKNYAWLKYRYLKSVKVDV